MPLSFDVLSDSAHRVMPGPFYSPVPTGDYNAVSDTAVIGLTFEAIVSILRATHPVISKIVDGRI